MRQMAIPGETIYSKIDRLVFRLVGKVARHQLLDHRDHGLDETLFRRRRKSVGALDLECVQILEERFLKRRREFAQRKMRSPAAANRLVIHVRQIHHPIDSEPTRFEMALEQVFKYIGAKISDLRVAINGWPALVHFHFATSRIERAEFLGPSRISIKKTDWHFGVL